MRPFVFTLQFLENNNLSLEATPTSRTEIVNKLQKTLTLNFHAAEGVRIERRIALALKSIKWRNSLVDACEKVDSSVEGDTELFGPEFANYFTQRPRTGNTIDTLAMCTEQDNLEVVSREADDTEAAEVDLPNSVMLRDDPLSRD